MTLSDNFEPKRQRTLGRWLEVQARKTGDGAVLRIAFYALLIGTIIFILLDYQTLSQNEVYVPQSPNAAPILPPKVRTDIDPNNPALHPENEIITNPELLAQPMSMQLLADGVLYLEGTISLGSTQTLIEQLGQQAEYIKTISLNSPGGVVEEAMMMGRLIRAGEFKTTVQAGHFCASSCPLILAGGIERTPNENSVIGVHQIYAVQENDRRAPAQAMSDAQSTTAEINRYLNDMGIDPKLWIHALETPPRQLYYLTAQEVVEFKLAATLPKPSDEQTQ